MNAEAILIVRCLSVWFFLVSTAFVSSFVAYSWLRYELQFVRSGGRDDATHILLQTPEGWDHKVTISYSSIFWSKQGQTAIRRMQGTVQKAAYCVLET